MTVAGIFDQFGAGGLQSAAGSAAQGAFMGSQQSAFSQQLAAAQNNDERAHQMNVAMMQMVQHQIERQRYNELSQMFGNIRQRDLYEEFTNRYVATPEAMKKCPPPRKPEECKPHPKAELMRMIGDAHIGDWMQPGVNKPGKIYKVDSPATMKFTAVSDPSCWIGPPTSNRDKLRAEVAAWTRRAA